MVELSNTLLICIPYICHIYYASLASILTVYRNVNEYAETSQSHLIVNPCRMSRVIALVNGTPNSFMCVYCHLSGIGYC